MRWFWIDRYIEFERGKRGVAIKNVSLAEEHIHDYMPGYPSMPASLIIEGIAQTSGLLISETFDYQARVVLAKVGKASFHRLGRPGETLTYSITVEDIQPDGSIAKGVCTVGEEVIAEVDLMFGHLDDRFSGVDMFDPAYLLQLLRGLRIYEIAKDENGQPLKIPQHLLDAETTHFS